MENSVVAISLRDVPLRAKGAGNTDRSINRYKPPPLLSFSPLLLSSCALLLSSSPPPHVSLLHQFLKLQHWQLSRSPLFLAHSLRSGKSMITTSIT